MEVLEIIVIWLGMGVLGSVLIYADRRRGEYPPMSVWLWSYAVALGPLALMAGVLAFVLDGW